MILTLIGVVLLVVGIILMYIFAESYTYDYVYGIGIGAMMMGFLVTIVCVWVIVTNHVTVQKDIYEAELERTSIVKQIEVVSNNYEDVSKATVIKNVYDWNKNVHSIKYWGKNPWTSWFWSQKYVDSLEYIEME